MKSHFEENEESNYGFDGLRRIFSELEIDMGNWVSTKTDKERGGLEFNLPNAVGEIYLNWGDLYNVDLTLVHSQRKFDETVRLDELKHIIKTLEEQREKHIDGIRNMLMKAFKEKESVVFQGKEVSLEEE